MVVSLLSRGEKWVTSSTPTNRAWKRDWELPFYFAEHYLVCPSIYTSPLICNYLAIIPSNYNICSILFVFLLFFFLIKNIFKDLTTLKREIRDLSGFGACA